MTKRRALVVGTNSSSALIKFRLPLGATLCIACLLIGTWIAGIFAYHLWNYFPINEVLPATMLPSALVPDAILMLSNSLTVTSNFGGMAFALLFYPSNWPIFGMFHVPLEYGGAQLTVADLFGFEYIRAGTPEYLRLIERGTLRTYGQVATPLSGVLLGVVVHADVPRVVAHRQIVRNDPFRPENLSEGAAMLKAIKKFLGLLGLGACCVTLAPNNAAAHGEKALEPFIRMRTIQWYDVQWSPEKLNVNDEVMITGKFHVAEDWPRGVPQPNAAYLNVS